MNKTDIYTAKLLKTAFYDDVTLLNKINVVKDAYENEFSSSLSLKETSKEISQYKRIAILAYIYLYCKLSDYVIDFNYILDCTDLPETVLSNYKYSITTERVEYIKSDFTNNNRDYVEIFNNPADYITKLITSAVSMPIQIPKKKLKNLNSKTYEHIQDQSALRKLSGNAILEKLMKLYSKYNIERLITIQHIGSGVKVTKDNLPYLFDIICMACDILDIKEIPDVYLNQDFLNAATIGSDKPILILGNSCLSLLSHDELLFVIGHELGHIKSQHVLYHTIGDFLPGIVEIIGDFTLGLGNIAATGMSALLYDWHRKSEYTADRAGLLVCQNLESAISTLYKLAGFPPQYYDAINTDDFLAQANEFDNLDNNEIDQLIKFKAAMWDEHPWCVMRAKELNEWVSRGGYDKVFDICDKVSNKNNDVNKCPHCGLEYQNTANFCKKCGQKL